MATEPKACAHALRSGLTDAEQPGRGRPFAFLSKLRLPRRRSAGWGGSRWGGAIVRRVTRWFCTSVVGAVLSGFALLLGTGRFRRGPILLELSDSHGLHLGDLFVIACWLLAMLALAWLAVRSRRPAQAQPGDAPLRTRS